MGHVGSRPSDYALGLHSACDAGAVLTRAENFDSENASEVLGQGLFQEGGSDGLSGRSIVAAYAAGYPALYSIGSYGPHGTWKRCFKVEEAMALDSKSW